MKPFLNSQAPLNHLIITETVWDAYLKALVIAQSQLYVFALISHAQKVQLNYPLHQGVAQ